jgi:hypothetical protein
VYEFLWEDFGFGFGFGFIYFLFYYFFNGIGGQRARIWDDHGALQACVSSFLPRKLS